MVNALSGYEVIEVATGKAHALFLTSCGKVDLLLVFQLLLDHGRFLLLAAMTMGSVDRERRLATWRNQKWSDDDPFSYFSALHVGQAL